MLDHTPIDKHISLGHLLLITEYLSNNKTKEAPHHMIERITRYKDSYVFAFQNVNQGWEHTFRISEGLVEDLGVSNAWMH